MNSAVSVVHIVNNLLIRLFFSLGEYSCLALLNHELKPVDIHLDLLLQVDTVVLPCCSIMNWSPSIFTQILLCFWVNKVVLPCWTTNWSPLISTQISFSRWIQLSCLVVQLWIEARRYSLRFSFSLGEYSCLAVLSHKLKPVDINSDILLKVDTVMNWT